LKPGLIKNALKNIANFSEFNLFEVAKIFNPEEKRKVAGLLYAENKQIFSRAKGVLELIWRELGISLSKIIYKDSNIYLGKEKLGQIDVAQNKFVVFEMDINILLAQQKLVKKYSKISSYPLVKRDLAFLLDKRYTWLDISKVVSKINPLIKYLELFDVFDCSDHKKGANLEGKKVWPFILFISPWNEPLTQKR